MTVWSHRWRAPASSTTARSCPILPCSLTEDTIDDPFVTRHLAERIDAAPPGTITRGRWLVAETPGGGGVEVPFTLVRGPWPGPTCWVIATRDGDEIHATLIALELQGRLRPDLLSGSVVIIPVVNMPGFEVRSRTHPLAPSYLAEALDRALFAEVKSSANGRLIDLHSAGMTAATVDWSLHLADDQSAEAMARAYGAPFLYAHRVGSGPNAALLDGALFVRATKAGIPAILIEAGGGLPPDPSVTMRGCRGVENVLRAIGILRGRATAADSSEPEVLTSFLIVTPTRGGVMEGRVALGQRVSQGQLLAVVRDLHGAVVEEIRSPEAAVLLTEALDPAVGTGTWAFELGW